MAKKILVVDDDPTGRMLMRSRLSKAGYDVAEASDGLEGLEAVKAGRPDLIVLDVEMPKMNGYSFMLELRKVEGCQTIPVIVLTAHEENKPIFQRRGISHYLVKPVNFDELFVKMNQLLV